MERSYSSRRHHHSRSDNNTTNPSFSSTLLDSIYRSFDDPSSAAAAIDRRRNCRPSIRCVSDDNYISAQKQSGSRQNGAFRRKSVAEIYSSSSSSDSSYGTGPAGFTSSESADDSRSNLKPIRTSAAAAAESRSANCRSEGGDGRKKKSRSLKNIYGDLKKAKQQHPISPGGRLASFLNSLFTAGNAYCSKNFLDGPDHDASFSILDKQPKNPYPDLRFESFSRQRILPRPRRFCFEIGNLSFR